MGAQQGIPGPRPPQVGDTVRCFFGTQSRIGTLEHITRYGWAQVRISPAWVHSCPMTEVYPADMPEAWAHAVARVLVLGERADVADPRTPLVMPSRRFTWGAIIGAAVLWAGIVGAITYAHRDPAPVRTAGAAR